MNLEMSWLDVVLMVLLAGIMVVGARRGLLSLATGLLSLLVWLVVNVFGGLHPLIGFLLALASGFGLAWMGRSLLSSLMDNLSDFANHAAGGIGGFLLGFCLICTLVLAFPRSYNPVRQAHDYPSASLPPWLGDAIAESTLQKWLLKPANRGGLALWTANSPLRALFTPDVSDK